MSKNISDQAVAPMRRALVSSTVIVMGATLASRVLGIVREIVLANGFGTSPEYGAYKAAFRIPDTLYLLIVGGALGSALIPVFSRFLGQNEQAKAWRLANTVVNYTMLTLTLCAGIAWLLAPLIVSTLLAPGFSPTNQKLTTDLTRLLLIQPFFMGLGGIALALLNGNEKFLWPALAPLVYNLSIIGGALFLVKPLGIYGVATGVIIGAILYLLVQLPALFRLGFYWQPRLEHGTPGASQVLRTLGPRLLGQAAFQANFFVATNLASGLPNGGERVAAFEYAYQLFMLPHGVFALSLATVAFPAMARSLGANDPVGMKRTLSSSLRQVLFFVIPAAVGLGLLATPIVKALLQSGQFGESSTALVSTALLFFSFGLIAYGVVEILTRAFYALQDTRTPVIVALITVGFNIGLSWLLVGPFQQGGLTLALALSTTVEMLLLAGLLYRNIGSYLPEGGRVFWEVVAKITLSVTLMGVAILIGLRFLQIWLDNGGKLGALVVTGLLIGLGGGVYAVSAYLLRVEELRSAVRRFIRRR